MTYNIFFKIFTKFNFCSIFLQNGFISALPYVALVLITLVAGQIVDRIRARKIFSITTLRKAQAIIGKTNM